MNSSAAKVMRVIKATVQGDASSLNDRELLRRYVEESNQDAFAALVRRHGELVHNACRRVLSSAQDAEDACQATFLVLAQKAGKQCWQPSVAGWLYQTARKVAGNALQSAQRRARREGRAAVREAVEPVDQVSGRELLAALDEELGRLPPRYREPLVLCYLEGLSREEVAARLGVKACTVKTQLERGRKKLGDALTRRGCGVGAGLLAVAVARAARASSPRLVEAILASASGSPPPAVAALIEGSTVNALLLKQKLLLCAMTAAVAVGVCLGALHLPAAGRQTEKAPPVIGAKTNEVSAKEKAQRKEPAKEDKAAKTFTGRVVDTDGRPIAGASVYVSRANTSSKGKPKPSAVTDAAGRFHITVPPGKGQAVASLFATAKGYGPAWVSVEALPWWPWPREVDKSGAITLRLPQDDVPATGRILNLEGKPIAGVKLSVSMIKAAPGGSLTTWLKAIKDRPNADGISVEYEHLPGFFPEWMDKLFPPITTGADGRFTVRGVGRERAVTLLVENPMIETKEINILTRAGLPPLSVPWYRNSPELGSLIYYAAGSDHPAAPCRPVSGVVRDRATGKPVAGATVRAERAVGNPLHYIKTTTDRAGRYRLTGLPSESAQRGLDTLVALPPPDQASLSLRKRIAGRSTIEPVTLDFELPQGLWIEGQVRDKVTGEGVEATLSYSFFRSERPEVDVRSLYLEENLRTDPQGRFRFVGVPVRALLGARAQGEKVDHYRVGVGADKIADKDVYDRFVMFRTLPGSVMSVNQDVFAEIKPTKGAGKVTCDLLLDPGQTRAVRVLGPDGKPLSGASAAGQFAREGFGMSLQGSECTVHGLTPGEPRFLLFQHQAKKLSALLKLKGNEKGTVAVTLQPSAAVSGRMVDAAGRPLRHTDIMVYYYHEGDLKMLQNHSPGNLVTDAEGRFRVGGMVPGVRYRIDVRLKGSFFPGEAVSDLSMKSGESRDLGDLKPRTKTQK